MPSTNKIQFSKSGYYLASLLILVGLGFWNSYFSKLLGNGEGGFNGYFHFHAIMAMLWIGIVIVQPFMIRNGKLDLHRQIGKLSYLIMPLVFISILLLIHNRHSVDEDFLGAKLLVPFKDLIILSIMYSLAIIYRQTIAIHARAMIATAIVFVEPSLLRAIRNYLDVDYPYTITAYTVYLLLIVLTAASWKYKPGRWVFPLVFLLYFIVHSILFFNIKIGFFESFAKWFIQLPLT